MHHQDIETEILVRLAVKGMAQAYNTDVVSQAANCSCSGAFVSQIEWAYGISAVQSKPTPTNFDLQPNSHTQPWSAI